jgi:hypothetical protein
MYKYFKEHLNESEDLGCTGDILYSDLVVPGQNNEI